MMEADKDKQRRKLALQKKYSQRITIARQGREAFLQKDYVTATKKYNEYLQVLAEKNDIDDIYALNPSMFDNKKDVTEMLLISHVYWEIARINEMTPKLQKNFQKALHQFIKFTINQPFQVFNAEMLRKYVRKHKASETAPMLNEAYQQIFVQSKKCYIATLCFGDSHPHTQSLRGLKKQMVKYNVGRFLVDIYYRLSYPLTQKATHHPKLNQLLLIFIRPVLTLLAKTLNLSIFK